MTSKIQITSSAENYESSVDNFECDVKTNNSEVEINYVGEGGARGKRNDKEKRKVVKKYRRVNVMQIRIMMMVGMMNC